MLMNETAIKFNQADEEKSNVPRGRLLELYTTMLKIRLVELKIEELYPKDEMKTPVHLCIGQEATAAGVCACLNKEDYVFSNHRGHGHYIAKGGDLKAMIAELYCKETGCSRGRGGSMHLVDTSVGLMGTTSIVGGGIPIATGAALGIAMQGSGRVSVAFFGDGAVDEGVLYESVNFAVLKKLPVVFVCENNFYSICSHQSKRHPRDNIFRRFEGTPMPGYRVDGTDVLAVYRIADKVIADVRSGKGPALVECIAYRWRGHVGPGPDVKLGYRTQEELDHWVERCPSKNFERFLLESGVLSERERDEITARVQEEIEEAFRFGQTSPLPNGNEITKYLFS